MFRTLAPPSFATLVLALVLGTSACSEPGEPVALRPSFAFEERASFVGSEACADCHDRRHSTWLATAHAYSLRPANERSVEGAFDGRPVVASTFVATPYMEGDDHYVRVEGRDGRPDGEHRLTRVVGRMFEQAYLFEGPDGSERVLPICWSIEREEWDLTHEVLEDISGNVGALPPDYDTRVRTFNEGCGICHATNYDPGFDPATGRYRSSQLEGAVSCESCHGPGSNHSAWHRAQDEAEDPADVSDDIPGAARLLHPAQDLDAQGVLESCGRCHYLHDWRFAIEDDPRVGYLDIATSMNHDRQGFTADGRLNGLNYHGSTQKQSACYEKGGMSCLSCHALHGGERFALKWEGGSDLQCTQCHDASAYQGREHTFHEASEAGCVDCHMPRLLPGVLHFMRDHSIVSPEPELTERFGSTAAPNACEPCHRDESAAWAREWKEKWWGPAPRRLVEDVGIVAALRRDPSEVETKTLVALAGRDESRHFFRMTALNHLASREGAAAAAARRIALQADEPELVQSALRGLIAIPDPTAMPELLALLGHPVRTVRIAAAAARARAGWRAPPVGVMAAEDGMMRAFRESQRMAERQVPSATVLTLMALCADAVGRSAEFEVALVRLEAGWPLAQWDGRMLELLHRRARNLTESGEHEAALAEYAKVRVSSGDGLPELLVIDSADSLAGTGQLQAAMGSWQYVLQTSAEGGEVRLIAQARLAAAAGKPDAGMVRADLERAGTSLLRDPAAGELLRRVRWSLSVLRGD